MRWLLTIVLAIAGGFAGAAAWNLTGFGGNATRDYILAHPEVLPEAMERLQLQQRQARLEPVRSELETPFPGAVLGNPEGKVTLVEFSDYACGYCRQSVDDVQKLIAANPDLRVVIRELPILSADSAAAARMALAAAQQGKYAEYHDAMFRLGPPSAETIARAAQEAELDLAEAQAAIDSGAFDPFLQTNVELANRIGIGGTPGWVVGDRIIDGAVGHAVLGEAIEEARQS